MGLIHIWNTCAWIDVLAPSVPKSRHSCRKTAIHLHVSLPTSLVLEIPPSMHLQHAPACRYEVRGPNYYSRTPCLSDHLTSTSLQHHTSFSTFANPCLTGKSGLFLSDTVPTPFLQYLHPRLICTNSRYPQNPLDHSLCGGMLVSSSAVGD